MKLALRQRGEENVCDGRDEHEGGDVQAAASAAVGAVGDDEHERESDGVGRHCHEAGARCGLVTKVLDDGWQEARDRCKASGGC